MPKWLSENEGVALALVVAGGVILRLAAVVTFQHAPESDEVAYKAMALNLLAGNGVVDQMGNRAMYNVGYPLFVLAPSFFVSPDSLLVARAFNVLLGAAAVVLCHRVARELGAGVLGRLTAAAFWSAYLPASVYAVYLSKENLMVPLVLGVSYYSLRLLKEPSRSAALGCGACLGLLALTGNAALSLAAMGAVVLFFTGGGKRGRAKLAALILLPAITIPTPWVIRNVMVLGAPALNTNGGFNLYLGNNPLATGMFISIVDTPRGATWEELRKQGEWPASEALLHEAVAWIVDHPADFAGLAVRKLGYFWRPPLHDGSGAPSRFEAVVRALWAAQFLILCLAAAGTVVLRPLRRRAVGVLWIGIAGYTGVHMVFYVIFRYREPIMPLLCVLAAVTVEFAVSRRAGVRASGTP